MIPPCDGCPLVPPQIHPPPPQADQQVLCPPHPGCSEFWPYCVTNGRKGGERSQGIYSPGSNSSPRRQLRMDNCVGGGRQASDWSKAGPETGGLGSLPLPPSQALYPQPIHEHLWLASFLAWRSYASQGAQTVKNPPVIQETRV